jgi:hypothetical protein
LAKFASNPVGVFSDDRDGGVSAEVSRTSALDPASVASPAEAGCVDLDHERQLALFEPAERDRANRDRRRNRGSGAHPAKATETRDSAPPAAADQAVLRALEEALAAAREAGDDRPALAVLAVLASRLGDLATPRAPPPADRVLLRQARDEWLRRLEVQQTSESTRVGYRIAIDDLLGWSETNDRDILEEASIVDYLRSYRQRASPAASTYYRRFVLLRRFLRWACRRQGLTDPFHDLEAPPKPRQESDWLTPEEFRRLLDAA